jgi:type I restriction enzyme S subunit
VTLQTAVATVPLHTVATIERTVVNPAQIEKGTLYVGLEHLDSDGHFVGVQTVDEGELASSKFAFSSQHVLYGKLRPYLAKIARPHFSGVCSTDILPILPGENLDSDFLCHFLRQPRMIELAASRSSGANLPRLSPKTLAEFAVPLPPLPEQRRIAAILDKADELRVTRRATLGQLNALTSAIFLEMFGDPVTNPKRWPDPKVGGLLTFQQYGPRFFNESYSDDGIRIVRITDLNESGSLAFSEMPRLAVSDADRDKYTLRPGDLIFARSGATVGKVAMIRQEDPSCIAGAYFITMRFASSLAPVYARAVLTAPRVRAIVAKRSRQAAQQNFSGPAVRQLPMPLPPITLQREFARRIVAVDRQESACRTSLAMSMNLFAALQQRAFAGTL